MGGLSFRRWLAPLSAACTLLVAAPLAAGFFGHLHPALDSFAHFRAHLAILMGLTALPLLATRYLKVGALLVLAAVLSFATTSGTVPIPRLGMQYGSLYPVDPERPAFKLMQLNLRYDNATPEQVLSMIGRVKPDVLTLDEVSDMWVEKLKLIQAAYPYRIQCPYPTGLFGVAILSRRPFAAGTTPHCDGRGAFALATIDFGGKTLDVAALHLGWPWPYPQYWEVGGLTPFFREIGKTAILAGDLNAAPWSRTPARVAEAGGLTPMPSPGSTWMRLGVPATLFYAGLPIDNVFAKGDVEVHSIRTLDPVGSDHLPVLVDFSLRLDAGGEHRTDVAAAGPESSLHSG
ncbi:endonuclease/exonuclease/phosphatase family protein [Mesorhizobium sp. LHD-90]|uniref:endonuclease/exonuclease/phosphatase family protein n=1 Tax=Mesorhizobium sp. LHD-90 TaxID=3071414 RepID=UPI0027DEDA18|nr:endonuclease/exonuclease/phosphatase family protein [Mesorhizobium sp. LHD-90]MDQ6436922.1 endonuclease/exonuclease/phosphatase family protein [Mesorhizobium sp. LHD-90]